VSRREESLLKVGWIDRRVAGDADGSPCLSPREAVHPILRCELAFRLDAACGFFLEYTFFYDGISNRRTKFRG
jgi:hypothetical protein